MPTAAALNYVRTGPPRRERAPVVLLHSAGLDLTYWDAQIAALEPEHEVIAFDLPGHGASPALADSMTMVQLALSVSAAVSSLDCGPANIVGLSVGGLVAQQLALTHPAVVASLTLLDTAARFGPAGQAAMRQRADTVRHQGMAAILDGLFDHWFLPETRSRRPDLVDRATKTLLHDDADVHAALWDAIAGFDVHDSLAAIHVPTLVRVGEHDSSSPVSSARELEAGIRHARLHVIDDAAHLSPIEQPVAVSGHLAAFFHSLTPARGR